MNKKIMEIATDLKSFYLESFLKKNNVSIFLCGGSSPTEAQFRRDLGVTIASTKSKYRYSVFFPEDMFVELILGHQRVDLLTLENLLAESVSAVAIIVQSPGTFAELGAFTNHHRLKNKLIVIMDPRHQKSQSFINTGCVRHLQKETGSRIIYHPIRNPNLEHLTKEVILAAREIGVAQPPTIDLTNPIACYEFYLALIYTLDPVPKSAILNLAINLQADTEPVLTAMETVVNALVNQRDALLVSDTLSISQKGIDTLFSGSRTDKRFADLQDLLSNLRIIALNVMHRKKGKYIWGEATVA